MDLFGTATCICLPGFSGDGYTCTYDPSDVGPPDATIPDAAPMDLSVIDSSTGDGGGNVGNCSPACGPDATCVVISGGGAQCWCDPGYAGDGFTCVDVNECALGFDDCGSSAICRNLPGSFACDCAPGYALQGVDCVDVDECASIPGPCGQWSACRNDPGSFTCTCVGGYVMGPNGCVPDVDECALGTANCDVNATCTDLPDGFTCTCRIGYNGDGTTCTFGTCDPSADSDTGSATFAINTLGLGTSSQGFNIDGINNSMATGGRTIAGCGVVDGTGGIDNGLGGIATALSSVIDMSAAFQDALLHMVPDGGYEGSLTISVILDHLAAGNAANDPCIGVTLSLDSGGVTTQVRGNGSLVNNVATVDFTGMIGLNFSLPVPPSSCTNGTCNPGTIAIAIRGGRARMTLDANHATILPGSLLGGYVFFSDPGAAYSSGNPSPNSTGFRDALLSFATMVNLDPNLTTTVLTAFQSAQDLHMEADGSLSPCTSPTNTVSNTNKNTVSVALLIDSQ